MEKQQLSPNNLMQGIQQELVPESGGGKRSLSAAADPEWILLVAVAIPAILVPLFVVYLPPDTLIEGGYELVLINEYQKYAAGLFTMGGSLGAFLFTLLKQKSWPYLPKGLALPALCFVLAIGISLLQAVDLWRGALVGLQVYLLPTVFFLLIASHQWTLSQGLSLLGLSLACGTLVAIIGVAQGLGYWGPALTLPHIGAGSLLFFQNLAGEYLIILIPPAIAITLMPVRLKYRLVASLVVVLLSTHLVLTLARGAWVGLIGGLCIGAALACCGSLLTKRVRRVPPSGKDNGRQPYKHLKQLIVGTIIALALSAGILLANGSIHTHFKSPYIQELLSVNFSHTTGRIQLWTDSLDMLRKNWLWGVGPGHYKVHIPVYLREIPTIPYLFHWDVKTGALTIPFRPHNDYLQNWLELGLLGMIGMIWLFGMIFWFAVRGIGEAVINGERIRALIILGTISGFAAWAVSMLFEFPFRMPASMILGWLCAGLAVSFSLQHRERLPRRSPSLASQLATGALLSLLAIASLLFAYQQFWSDLYFNQAMIAGASQNPSLSYAWMNRACAYAPWKEQTGATKARLELLMDKPEQSLDSAREVLRRNPYSLPGLWAYGLAAGELGHEQESRSAFQKIINIYPFLPDIARYQRFAEPIVPVPKRQ